MAASRLGFVSSLRERGWSTRVCVYVDLVGLDEDQAREALLTAAGPITRPKHAVFPGTPAAAGFPGSNPRVSNLQPRMRTFAGRDEVLERLHARLQRTGDDGSPMAAVQVPHVEAIHGLGGVGKSALALEFAHRYGNGYDIVWWVPAEQPATTAGALAALAAQLGVPCDDDQLEAVRQLFDQLRRRDGGWLLVYDNAEQPDVLEGLCPPGGAGHVLVTSRWSAWAATAVPLRLDVFGREESIRYLTDRTGSQEIALIDELAGLVGDLPLALAEAAAYLEQTAVGVAAYLDLLRDRAQELFGLADFSSPSGSAEDELGRRRVATVWSVSLDRVRAEAPGADLLLNLCAFLAPDIPRTLLTTYPDDPADGLAAVVGDPLTYNAALAALGRYSLVTLTPETISLHRLVQAVIRARLTPAELQDWSDAAVRLLRHGAPRREVRDDPSLWPAWDSLLPHVVITTATDRPLNGVHDDASWLLDRAGTYLQVRGNPSAALPFFERAYAADQQHYGDNHPETFHAANNLASCLFGLKEYQRSRELNEETLLRRRQVLGPGHPDTLTSANNLANDLAGLGLKRESRKIHHNIYTQRKSTLGREHRDTLTSASNYAGAVFDSGHPKLALRIDQDVLNRRRRSLGEDDPDTLVSAHNLAIDCRALDQYGQARELDEDTYARRRRVLGDDHPATIKSSENVALDLHLLGAAE